MLPSPFSLATLPTNITIDTTMPASYTSRSFGR